MLAENRLFLKKQEVLFKNVSVQTSKCYELFLFIAIPPIWLLAEAEFGCKIRKL